MLKKFFKKIACKYAESELDNLIGRFSTDDPEKVYLLHTAVASIPCVWRSILDNDYSDFFDELISFENKDLDEKMQQKIATHTQVFIQLQKQSNEELTKFGLWFWKVMFVSMLHPELKDKGKNLTKLIQDQSNIYTNELARRAEEGMGQKVENAEILKEHNLFRTLPSYFK